MAKTNVPAVQRDITDSVLVRINEFREAGELAFPQGYSPENALKSAALILTDVKTKDNKPVLEHCTKNSIANSLLEMVVQGLSPMKKQCSFIAYGNKLSMQREYNGTIALAKRFAGVKDTPVANIIYEGDEFVYEIDPETGKKKIVKHVQSFENIDNSKIKGAYAVVRVEGENLPYIEIMNMKQIRDAWNQGPMKGNSPAHKNFPDQMSKKTVINRGCKILINSSDDSVLALIEHATGKQELSIEDVDAHEVTIEEEIKTHSNQETISMDDEPKEQTTNDSVTKSKVKKEPEQNKIVEPGF
jgi:recombination protein RecT